MMPTEHTLILAAMRGSADSWWNIAIRLHRAHSRHFRCPPLTDERLESPDSVRRLYVAVRDPCRRLQTGIEGTPDDYPREIINRMALGLALALALAMLSRCPARHH